MKNEDINKSKMESMKVVKLTGLNAIPKDLKKTHHLTTMDSNSNGSTLQ
jgi:hypothetical protein